MEKITFIPDDTEEEVDFYVLEETRLNGVDYILVTDSQEEDGEAEALYEIVEDDEELESVGRVFEQLLEDVDITL